MTVANLGLAVDSGPVARAAVDLDKLVASSNSADVAVTKLGTSSDKAFMQVSNGAGVACRSALRCKDENYRCKFIPSG
jgi:hypothetical protein